MFFRIVLEPTDSLDLAAVKGLENFLRKSSVNSLGALCTYYININADTDTLENLGHDVFFIVNYSIDIKSGGKLIVTAWGSS